MKTDSSKRPRLMFVLGLAPKKIGGIEKFLKLFTLALDAAGWDTVLCFDGEISDVFREYVSHPGVFLEPLNNQGDAGFVCAPQLWKLLGKYKPQTFMYAFHSVIRCFPWLARMAGCKRIVFNDHSSRAPGYVARPLSGVKRLRARMLTSPVDLVISVANFTRQVGETIQATTAPNVVISNGVEIRPKDTERAAEFRRLYKIAPDRLVIAQVCWMVPVKGVDTMLRAAKLLLADGPNVQFVLVGEGDLLQQYREDAVKLGIEDRVTFTGLIQNPTESGLFDASDIYCQPSVWQEACPLAVLEAMSARLPVIASNTGGLPELVSDGTTGLLVPVKDEQALCAALGRLAEDASLRQSMGEAGYETVVAHHQLHQTVEAYVDLLLRAG